MATFRMDTTLIKELKVKVYKYMRTHIKNRNNEEIDILKYIFEDKTLWFANPLTFNDPFELKPNIKQLVNEGNSFLSDVVTPYLNITKQAYKFHYASVHNILNNIGVLSLSGNKDNLAMWAHYANNHQGLVLEFEGNHWFFNDLTLPEYAKVLQPLEKVIYIQRENRKSICSDEYFTKQTFLTKSEDWEYEDEYRMSVYVETEDQYLDGICLKFLNDLLTSIYLGNKIDIETKNYILNLLNEDEWKHLNIFQMEIDEKAYKLTNKQINGTDFI